MTEEDNLETAFNVYLKLARAELRPRQVKPSNVLRFELIKSTELSDLVDEIESRPEFQELLEQTLVAFPREDPEEPEPSRLEEIKNFFRRSRYYMSIYTGKDVDVRTTLHRFIEAFRKEEIQVRYLVALGGINFDTDTNAIDFGSFWLRRFSAEGLGEILQTDVNEVFYREHTLRDDH